MMYQYDLFLSYSSRDTNQAQQIVNEANQLGLTVFLAKRDLAPGDDWEELIRLSLLSSREVGVLVTNDSLQSNWVTSEWAAAWLLQRVATPILKDVTVDQLPERLKRYQYADYYKIDQYLMSLLKRKKEDPLNDDIDSPYKMFSQSKDILPTLFAPTTGQSPFVFKDLLSLTEHNIFISGQNLYTLFVRLKNETNDKLFNFLRTEGSHEVSILICDPLNKAGVETWTSVCGIKYERDLLESIKELQTWVKVARNENLHLEVKLAPFVPVSITFVDTIFPYTRTKLFLTPNVFEPSSAVRTCFFLYGKLHGDVVTKYWENYDLEFKRAKDITEIEKPYIENRLQELKNQQK